MANNTTAKNAKSAIKATLENTDGKSYLVIEVNKMNETKHISAIASALNGYKFGVTAIGGKVLQVRVPVTLEVMPVTAPPAGPIEVVG